MEWIHTYSDHAAFIALFLTVAVIVSGFFNRLNKNFKKNADKAEVNFKQEMERFRSAGSTVSARTDLGFFVQLELESLRGALAEQRFFVIMAFLITFPVIIYFTTSFTAHLPRAADTFVFKKEQKDFFKQLLAKDLDAYKKAGNLDALLKNVETPLTVEEIEVLVFYKNHIEQIKRYSRFLMVLTVSCLIFFFMSLFGDRRSRKRIIRYEVAVKDIWKQPIDKRADKV